MTYSKPDTRVRIVRLGKPRRLHANNKAMVVGVCTDAGIDVAREWLTKSEFRDWLADRDRLRGAAG